MASACVKKNIGICPDTIPECSPLTYGWLSPRISPTREISDENAQTLTADPEYSCNDVGDFEFRLEDPAMMLPADELFSDGKLLPLRLSMIQPANTRATSLSENRSPNTPKSRGRCEISSTDPYLFSPKAPRCYTPWKELLGLKKLSLNTTTTKQDTHITSSSVSSRGHNTTKSIKHYFKSSLKSSNPSIHLSPRLPLLKDSDNYECVSSSSRLSLSSSSSSSGHDHDDIPRLSLDSEKPGLNHNPKSMSRNGSISSKPRRDGVVKKRALLCENKERARTITVHGVVCADSPRMNSSGKIVFHHGLERSWSSPSSINGGGGRRFKYRGMERSYSANVRVTPLLNVPVRSRRGGSSSSSKSGMAVFGFPLFSSPQKRENSGGGCGNGVQQCSRRNR